MAASQWSCWRRRVVGRVPRQTCSVTAVPKGNLQYLTVWPTGQTQPTVSTLNSYDSRIKANAAIIPAGSNGAISVFATDDCNVILDVRRLLLCRQLHPLRWPSTQ